MEDNSDYVKLNVIRTFLNILIFSTKIQIDIKSNMKNTYFFLCALLLLSCGNNPKTKSAEDGLTTKEPMVVKEKLDSVLVKGVFEQIQPGEHLKYPDIPLNESFISIWFRITSDYRRYNFSDSIIDITYNVFGSYENAVPFYKGILDIDGYNVAIFDGSNFGGKYYNVDSLKQIPLERFKPYPVKAVTVVRYFVQNGKLYTLPEVYALKNGN